MVYVKTAIFTILAIICLLVGYMFFTFNTDYEVNIAHESFLKGDYEKSLKDLGKLNDSTPSDRLYLYQAYVYRELRDLDKSNEMLEKAVFQARKHNQPLLSLEIFLNQCLNGYLSHNDAQLSTALANAEKIDNANSWVIFFQALAAYQNDDYQTALDLWSGPSSRVPLSGWMKKAFDEVFTTRWLALKIARCQIETDAYLVARQSLESQIAGADAEELNSINFLIGLSYAKEAEGKPPTAAAPYYKLAFSYFNRVPMQQESFAGERQRLLTNMQKVIQQLIEARSFGDLPFYAGIMQAWSAQDEINHLVQQLSDLLNSELAAGHWAQLKEITGLLNRLVPEGDARQNMQKRFQELAVTALEAGSLEHAADYWEAAMLFSDSATQATRVFANQTAAQIEGVLKGDDANLTKSLPYLGFLLTIEKDPAARLEYANRLVDLSSNVWKEPGQQPKAIMLMRAALTLAGPENQLSLQQTIGKSIIILYENAVSRDDVDLLPYLLDAVRLFDLKQIDIQRDQEVQKQLTAAKKAIQQKDLAQALKRIKWVLRLDAQNKAAKVLAGEVLYQQADYAAALPYLSEIPSPTLEQTEALAVSKMLAGEKNEGQQLLDQIQSKSSISQDAIFRLGIGMLLHDHPKEASEWLQKLPTPTPEVVFALAYADLLLKNYDGVLIDLGTLQPPYSSLDAAKGMMIQAQIGLGDEVGAEKNLNELVAAEQQPSLASLALSKPFGVLVEERLAEFNRYFIAGLYHKQVKRDNETAFKYFTAIKDPTPHIRILTSETLASLGRYAEAIDQLNEVLQGPPGDELKRQALPLLGVAQAHLGNDVEAFQAFRDFFVLEPDNLDYRGSYADVLMRIHRFDLAVAQYVILKDKLKLTPSDAIGFVESLVYTAHPNEAIEEGTAWLKSDNMPSLAQRLEIARWMVVAGYAEGSWDVAKNLPDNDKLTTDQATALIQFFMQLGAYQQAVTVVQAKLTALQETSTGLMTLANLADRLTQPQQALFYAQQALKLQPGNQEILDFICQHTKDISFLESTVREAAQKMEADPDSITKRLDYARQVAYLGSVATSTPGIGFPRYQQEVQRTLFIIDKTSKAEPEIPRPLYLKGSMEALLSQPDNAGASFFAALKLDPSYKEANLGLVDLALALNDEKSAIKALFQVVRYFPDDANAWKLLANQFAQQGYFFEASNFYEYAIKFAPNDISNYISLARVFLELRNPEDARTILTNADKANPNNPEVLKLLLTTLYDSALQTTVDDPKALTEAQKEVYNRLHAIDAKVAEDILKQVGEHTPPGQFDYPPLDIPIQ